jgi:hypothetical protein
MTAGGFSNSEVKYHPPSSIAHEIGIAVGFLIIMILSFVSFSLWWKWQQKREVIKERERCAGLSRRGFPAVEKFYDDVDVVDEDSS